MAKKKKRGRRQPKWKKWARAGLGITGAIIGTAVATSPLHKGIAEYAAGNFEAGTNSIIFQTTGMVPGGNVFPNVNSLVRTGVVVVVGVGLMSLFRYISRRV